MCGVLNSADKIVTVHRESNAEVTTEQLAALKSLQVEGNCSYTLECPDVKYIVNQIIYSNIHTVCLIPKII